jgi:hypothetical protein
LGNTKFINMECYFAKTSYVALKGFLTATTAHAADKLLIDGCYIHGDPVANCTNAIQLVGGDSIVIRNSYIRGAFTTSLGPINNITADVAGISIVGLGTGNLRPTINWTATAGTFLVSADNVTIQNLYCTPTGIDAVVTPFSLTSALGNTKFINMECYFAKTSYVALKGFLTATTAHAADKLLIDGCYIHGDPVANCTNAIQLVGGDSIVIRNSYIRGAFTTSLGPINNITAAVTGIQIDGNTLINTTAVSTKAIVLLTGSTGSVTNNRIGILNGSAPVTADAIEHVGGNYYTAAVGVSAGTLL